MIVVDTSVWIDYLNNRPTAETGILDRLLEREGLVVGDLVLVDILQGFRSDLDFHRVLKCLGAFPFREMGGYGVAVASAQNYRALRARGVTVRKTIDVIIATFCIVNGQRLLHSDRDFDPMERHLGLRVVRG
ncbi:MAG: type II toxin-antitoxin system VapC family toxin [Candidatus Binataceae bacterium]